MNETNTPATSKWWLDSLTIRGALVSAASAALPIVGVIAGIDLSGDTVRQLGEQTVTVLQAVGGLAGMVMTIAGRTRATLPLERRSVRVLI